MLWIVKTRKSRTTNRQSFAKIAGQNAELRHQGRFPLPTLQIPLTKLKTIKFGTGLVT